MAMNLGDAVLKISGDTKDLDRAMEQSEKKVGSVMERMSGSFKMAGAALTGVGVAGLALVSSARKMNATLGMTGRTIGATTGEMRKLVLSTTNVTFPLESVVNTFELLAKAGIRDQEVLKATATAFDTLADATGSTAEQVAAKLIPAFKALGEDIPQTAAELDKFTFLTKNTTVSIDEFGSVMSYVAQFGDDLNLSLDDMVAVMTVLESKGKSGSTATKMFRTALSQAANGTATLNEALGITAEELAAVRVEMDGTTGSTQEYADIANSQFGIMDKLKQKWSELTFQLGSYLTPLEPVMAGMTALGPLFLILSTNMGVATVKWIAHTAAMIASKIAMIASIVVTKGLAAAQWLLNAAMTANPIGIIIVAIGALIAIGVLLWKNWDTITKMAKKMWDIYLGLYIRGLKIIKAIVVNTFNAIKNFFKEHWDKMLFIALTALGPAGWLIGLLTNVGGFRDKFLGIFGKIWSGIKTIFEGIKNAMIWPIKSAINIIIDAINVLIRALNTIQLPSWVPGIGGKGINIPEIPHLAKGAIITKPTLAMLGEGGKPEGVFPLDRAGGMMGTQMVQIVIEMDGDVVGEKIVDLVRLKTAASF